MFSEWTDPYDIDHYYDDINGLMADVRDSPSSTMYQNMPVQLPSRAVTELKPEQPTGVIVNNVPITKSAFEVAPGSTFVDGHPVGRQPEYNILRSGPPAKESGRLEAFSSYNRSNMDWIHIIMFVVFVFLVGMVLQSRQEVKSANMTMKMLLAMLKSQSTPVAPQ
jgi:hypothetical protein